MILKNKSIILFCILFLAALLRFWQLGSVPISPDWDEVTLGYNAYSIMHTGKDEYGKVLPFVLRSYDDYKPALYSYLTMPFILLLGLNVLAVRLPAAIIGVFAVLGLYLLVKELTNLLHKETNDSEALALIAAFFLAVSPWHIQFSRVGFEACVGMTFNLFGALFFLKGLKKHWLLFFSAVLFGLNIYVYQSEKVFMPLFVMLLCALFIKTLLRLPRRFLISSACLGLVIILPMLIFLVTDKEALERAKGVSIFTNNMALLQNNVNHLEWDQATHNHLAEILDNRRFEYGKIMLSNYLSHFDLNWLFIMGDSVKRHHAPDMALIYITLLPFLFIGIYRLFTDDQFLTKQTKLFLIGWFLLSPVPASITTGVPSAVRTINSLPPYQIIFTLGLLAAFYWIKRQKYIFIKFILILMFVGMFLFNFLYYLDQYFVQQNRSFAGEWQYGYQELVTYLKPLQAKYDKILVSTIRPMDQSYMFFLFYLQYDPQKYQQQGGTVPSGGLYKSGIKIDNFVFRPFSYPNEQGKLLLVGSAADFKEEYKVIKRIYYPDGVEAMRVVEKD